MDIDVSIAQLKGLVSYFQKYRDSGFEKANSEAKILAESMEIEAVFPKQGKRVIKRKIKYGESSENVEGSVTLSPEEKFRVDYFIQRRLSISRSMKKIFGFLFDLKKLQSASDDSLMVSCANLGDHSDIVGTDLFAELKIIREALPERVKKPTEVLDFLQSVQSKFMDCLSNIVDHPCFGCIYWEEFFEVEVNKILSSFDYVTRKIE
uniref:Uncharacterized protein n=1 Tax=Brassica oleracea var. oleracea TaxID=109376 RepID=A0A0D3AB81_BRAOL